MIKPVWKNTDHLVLAVSTGIDSMVLLHQLIHHYRETYRQLSCVHVHHGLREASDREAAFIERYCQAHHIPIYIHHLDLEDVVIAGRSIQNEARKRRYAWFDAMMARLEGNCLLTAHHQDDQLETIFYRIFTGRSTRSPLGMNDHEKRKGYQLIRPLIHTTKQQIRDYQSQYHVPYYEDESNQSNDYVRNDIRNRILPTIAKNPQLQNEQLLKLYDMQVSAQVLIRQQAFRFIDEHVKKDLNRIIISRNEFNQELIHVKMKILDYCISQFDEVTSITEKAYHDWFEKLDSQVAQTALMHTNKWHAYIVYDKLILTANDAREFTTQKVHITKPGWYDFGDYRIHIMPQLFETNDAFWIRTRYNGDRVVLHSGHHKKVSRLMIDAKVPTLLRERMPIVVDASNRILAVGHLYIRDRYANTIHIQYLGDDINEK